MANILHVTHRYWPVVGGSESYVRAFAERQADEGHLVTVLATDADEFSAFWDPKARKLKGREEYHRGVRIIRTPISYLPGKPWSFGVIRRLQVGLSWAGKTSAYLGRLAPYLPNLSSDAAALGDDWDAVVGWNIAFDGLMAAASRAAAISSSVFITVPLLHLGEGPRSPVRRFYTMPHQLAYLRSADLIIAQSTHAREFLIQKGFGDEQITVAGAGVDPGTISGGDAGAFRLRYNLAEPIVIALGALTHDKGTMQLIEAARLLWAQGLVFTVVLAGSIRADFKTYWEKIPETDRRHIRILGRISEIEKRDLLAAAHLLSLTSRTDSFGIVFLEAWCYGKPVIGADAGGIPTVITDGIDGRLVPFGDAIALSKAIAEILESPQKAKAWGAAGRRKTLERHTWDAVYERFKAGFDAGRNVRLPL